MEGWIYSSPSAHKNLTELTKLQLLIRKQHSHIIAYAVRFLIVIGEISPHK
jgi:hypothetical protein